MSDALWVALGGMAIVFCVLALLLLAMVLIKRAFPAKEDKGQEGA